LSSHPRGSWITSLPAGFPPQSGKMTVLNLLTGQNQHFCPIGATHCTDSREIWQDRGHVGSLGRAKFHINWCMLPPKWQKFPLYGTESHRRGKPFDRFLQLLEAFIPQLSCIRVLHLRWFASQVTELLLRNCTSVIYPNFSMHRVGKTIALDRKMTATFLLVSTSSITMQSLGEIELRAPAVGMIMWCLYVLCIFCHALRLARCLFEGDIVWTSIVSWFMGRFWCCLQGFSRKGLPFQNR